MTTSNAVKLIEMNESTATVAGYGVVFGGADLDGDTFSSETDYMLDLVPSKLTFYDHRLGNVKHVIGLVSEVKADDKGLWIQAQLDRSKEYVEEVLKLVKAGVIGWSSGSVPHLVDREGGTIKSWPIIEFSLTPTPAEPRTLGVVTKSAAGDAAKEQVSNMNTDEIKETAEAKEPQAAPLTIEQITAAIKASIEPIQSRLEVIEKTPVNRLPASAAPVLKNARGDSHANAFKAWVRDGDGGGLYIPKGQEASYTLPTYSVKASNATDMNIGTAADGGNAVPTGFLAEIIARRDESSLLAQLPLRAIPGVGTTVDVPLDNEADGEFVSTNEAATFDQDAPAIGKKSLTLVKYTKYTDVSYELLEDTPTNLEAFLADFVGRGLAKTYNNLILTEVASNGTNFKTFAGTGAIAFGEPEDIVGNVDLAPYLDEDNAVAWVTRSSTFWDIKSIVGNDRQYAVNMDGGRSLLGYPVYYSQKAAAMAASAKSIYFGNWRYVGYREAPGLTFLRNPYSAANSGQVRLHWYMRFVAGVLQAEAIGYGTQAAA